MYMEQDKTKGTGAVMFYVALNFAVMNIKLHGWRYLSLV